jgi:hypothetical protein
MEKEYECAVLYDDHTWEDGYWVMAESEDEAVAKVSRELAVHTNICHITVILQQDVEEQDED